MTIPLTQIHVVDRLDASYWDLAMINVAIVQGLMALTMPFWGKLVDRHSPSRLRGFINLIFALDFLALAIAPSIGWVYAGRVCRGIALGGGTLVWMLGSLYYARTPDKVPIYLGVHTVLTGVRWALAPFAGVWLKQACGDDARPVFTLVYLVVVSTALLMIHRPGREAPRPPLETPPMPAPRMTGA
jgi:MFS family permease